LVSASIVTSQTISRGVIIIKYVVILIKFFLLKFMLMYISKLGKIIIIIAISYEIVWAVARYDPKILYLLTDAHPLVIKKKILTLKIVIIYIKVKLTLAVFDTVGYISHIAMAIIIKATGAFVNTILFALFSLIFSFVRSLIASLNGCITPLIPTLLGPSRKCVSPINLRSIRVKNATEIRIGTNRISVLTFKGFPFNES